MFTVIFCVFFQTFILSLVFIFGCGKNRILSKKAANKRGGTKSTQKKLPTPTKPQREFQELQRQRQQSSSQRQLQQQQQQQQLRQQQQQQPASTPLQSDRSQQKIKQLDRRERKKEEEEQIIRQQLLLQQQHQQQISETPAQIQTPQTPHPPAAAISEPPRPEEDEDLCFDAAPIELKKLVQELECY
uniref:Uncharacterized protein n=1 Tax=Panagrolaimus sp. ES5 TaxID=591445 RepID=A0AC34F087_9BILA